MKHLHLVTKPYISKENSTKEQFMTHVYHGVYEYTWQ